EKGYKHWGHDLGPTITPLEAGLGACVNWKKPFLGRDALLAQRERGLSRRLHLMAVDGGPLLLHDEPVFEAQSCVGMTTSGAVGARTGLHLCFAMVDIAPGESMADTAKRQFEIEVAGVRHTATALEQPPYDPCGVELRA
ncbi:MAG: glycine cleavage T C-terminal barrel domain-containing protein, partial [Pseudomonadota bacterium]